jgi:hypothetical protein
MKRFEIDLLVGDENISVDRVEGQHLSSKDTQILQKWLFGHAINFAHVE